MKTPKFLIAELIFLTEQIAKIIKMMRATATKPMKIAIAIAI